MKKFITKPLPCAGGYVPTESEDYYDVKVIKVYEEGQFDYVCGIGDKDSLIEWLNGEFVRSEYDFQSIINNATEIY